MIPILRVGAVGNALSAFSKALWAPLCASTTPAASRRSASSLPSPGRLNSARSFIEPSKPNRAEVEVPLAVVDRFEADRLTDQHRADHPWLRVPPHDARRGHAAQFIVPRVDQRRQ